MTTGLLELTGRHATLDPAGPWGRVIGERPLPKDFGLEFVERAARDPEFSYGQPLGEWPDTESLPRREDYRYGTISGGRVNEFYREVSTLWPPLWGERAVTAMDAILEVVNSPEETEALALEVPYAEWYTDRENALRSADLMGTSPGEWSASNSELLRFTDAILKMVDAYDEPSKPREHLLRNDFIDEENPARFGDHGTIMWLGTGEVPVIVIEESDVAYGEDGHPQLVRQLWIAKRFSAEEALRLANRHTLIARKRMADVLDRHSTPATPEEKEHVLWYADRSRVKDDADAVAWLEWYRDPFQPNRWQLMYWKALGVLAGLADVLWQRAQPVPEDEETT